MIVLYLGATWGYWSEMVENLSDYARDANVPTSQAVTSE
jgi:hypothetical protein